MSDRMEGNATRMRASGENERLVDLLRTQQLSKLAANDHKGHWGNEDPRWLLRRARQELDELDWEIEASAWESGYPGALEKILGECADVANFVAMIADVVLAHASKGRADL